MLEGNWETAGFFLTFRQNCWLHLVSFGFRLININFTHNPSQSMHTINNNMYMYRVIY